MRTTDLHCRGETSYTRHDFRVVIQDLQEKTTRFTFHIKKEPLKQQLHLRRNSDQGQTGATSEGSIADGRQRGRQEHFTESRIDKEGVLETNKINQVNRK